MARTDQKRAAASKDEKAPPGLRFDAATVTLKKTPAAAPPKPKTIPGVSSSVVFDEATDTLTVKKFPPEAAKAIRQAREKLQMTQKDLARKINKPATLIVDIEKGAAIYDADAHAKIQKVLGLK